MKIYSCLRTATGILLLSVLPLMSCQRTAKPTDADVVTLGPRIQVYPDRHIYFDAAGAYKFEDIGKNGTPDIYYDWAHKQTVHILHNGVSETGYSIEGLINSRTVDAESEDGKLITNECLDLMAEIGRLQPKERQTVK